MDMLCFRFILICAKIAATTMSTSVMSTGALTTPTSLTQVSGISSDSPTSSTTPVSVTTVSYGVNISITTPPVSNGKTSVSPEATSISSLVSTATSDSETIGGITTETNTSTLTPPTTPSSYSTKPTTSFSQTSVATASTSASATTFRTSSFETSALSTIPSISSTRSSSATPAQSSSSDTSTSISLTTSTSPEVNQTLTVSAISMMTTSTSTNPNVESSTSSTYQITNFTRDSTTVTSTSEDFSSTSLNSSTLKHSTATLSSTSEIPTTTTSTASSFPTTFFTSSIFTSTPLLSLTSTTSVPQTSSAITTTTQTTPTTTFTDSSTSSTSETTTFTRDSTTVSPTPEEINSTTTLSSTLRTAASPSSTTEFPTTTSTASSFPTTFFTSSIFTSTPPFSLTSTTSVPQTSSAITTTTQTTPTTTFTVSSTSSTSETTTFIRDSTTVSPTPEEINSTTTLSSTLRTAASPSSTTEFPTTTTSTASSFPTTFFTSSIFTSTPPFSLTSTTSVPQTSSAITTTTQTTPTTTFIDSSTSSTSETTTFTRDSTTVSPTPEDINSTTTLSSTPRTAASPSSTTEFPTTTTSTASSFPTTFFTSSIFTSTPPSSLTSTTSAPPTSSAVTTTQTTTTTTPLDSSTSSTSETTNFTLDNTTVSSSSDVFNSTTSFSSTLTTEEISTTVSPSITTTTTAAFSLTTINPDMTQTSETRTSPTSTESFSSLKTSTISTTERHTTPVRDCGNPPVLENGNVDHNGSVATYYCKPGYNGTNVTIMCQLNGSWEHLSVTCSPVDCGVLSPYSNASITYIPKNTTHFGTVAVLQCQTGYTISNTSKSTSFRCNESAAWNGNSSVTCKLINCEKLDPLVNGKLSTYNTTVASLVKYECNNGYTLNGFQSRICLESGEWSRSTPTCKKDPEKPVKPCPNNTDSRKFQWNETKAGQSLSIPCSLYNQNLSGEITRNCTKEGLWLLPNYNCTRKEVEAIKTAILDDKKCLQVNGIKENPSEENVEAVLGDLSKLTNQSTNETTYAGEIQAITESLQIIADINYTNIDLTEKQSKAFLETTSNLLDPSNAESWQSIDQESEDKEEASGASKMLNVVSKYTDAISNSLDNSEPKRTIPTANLILQVRLLNNSDDITFPEENDNISSSSSLVLSKNALKGSTKYSAVIYKNLTGVLSTKGSSDSEDLELGSSVMSVKLNNWKNSDFRIQMTFENVKQNDLEPRCSFSNESRNYWETAGCERKSFNASMTTCECDHLTNFAILMSPWTEENVETKAIRIVSIIGCSVSVLGLLLTMLAHGCYWRYVKSDRVKILMNLCIALLISYGLFLGGVDRTSNKDLCTTMAVLLQYIYLVVFFLMLAEGIEIAVVVLYVFLTKSRLKWILPCAWFIPALIVGISLAVTQTKGYGNSEFCWLSVNNGLIWAFVGPALLIIVVNFVLLVLILKTIFKTKNLAQKSNKQRAMAGIRCLCVLLPLVGCTWVIGIFYVNASMAWIQYVFAVCNSLQGLVIFIFHCALNTQLKQAFQRRRKLSGSASYTRSTSNALNLIPRAKMSQTASDLYCSIGTETTFQRSGPSFETYDNIRFIDTDAELPRLRYQLDFFDD